MFSYRSFSATDPSFVRTLAIDTNLMGRCTYLDPPKSPLRRGVGGDFEKNLVPPLYSGELELQYKFKQSHTLRRILSPPPTRGVRGDQILCSLIKNWYEALLLSLAIQNNMSLRNSQAAIEKDCGCCSSRSKKYCSPLRSGRRMICRLSNFRKI